MFGLVLIASKQEDICVSELVARNPRFGFHGALGKLTASTKFPF